MEAASILILLAAFQVKHMLADYFLQTSLMLANRAVYLHPGRALHCLVHVVGSLLCLLAFGIPVALIILVLVAEWIAHYHIDFAKGVWSDRAAHTPSEASYWRAFGADQLLHQLTYVGMVWAVT
ncbi:MAG: DUF3307 domain-containing protein [Pseudomonadota bacterium]